MKKRSIGINAVINGIKTIVSVIFPLITYPYISRILEVENVGRYNFSHSVIDYFYLLSALGIATYAVREGTNHRESREEVSHFASEVFTINIFSTVISYMVLGLIILASPKLQDYTGIILVLSVGMIFTTFGCEWVYTIYEEYLYIAIRTIVFQVISLILLFMLVKSKEDVLWYAVVIVVSSSGANIINLLGLKKYCTIKLCIKKEVLVHLVPILILFANSIATRIYVNSDITVLGFLTTDYDVGIYSIASKVYSITKQVLSAIIIVSIPRLSFLWGSNRKKEYKELTNRILYLLVTLVVPAVVGLFSLSGNVILVISTEEFITARTPLCLLSIALLFCLFNWFYTSCVLIPCKREKQVLAATAISAAVNLGLNFLLIPLFKENAAALTTVIAEACSLAICVWNSRDILKVDLRWRDIISTVIGCASVFAVCMITCSVGFYPAICIVISVVVSAMLYSILLIIMKNSTALFVKDIVLKRIKR